MTWVKLDDKWFSNRKLRALPRSARGLFADLLSWSGGEGSDGWLPATSLGLLEASPTDPDFKRLVGVVLHKKGDDCRCLSKRKWEWPRERGWVVHDFLLYNPAADETAVRKAQKAELRNWGLRSEIRNRDHGCCRYCAREVKRNDAYTDVGETVDHVNPLIADGAANLVLACRECNGRKKNRTPEQAGMVLLSEAELAQIVASRNNDVSASSTTTSSQTVRVGSGQGRVGSGTALPSTTTQVGPPTTPRDSANPNPYLRVHASPDDAPAPDTPPGPARASPPPPRRRQPKPKKNTSRRRRR